jgi:hypothetical protein
MAVAGDSIPMSGTTDGTMASLRMRSPAETPKPNEFAAHSECTLHHPYTQEINK